MSWAGFKKNVNRATTQVMMKTGPLSSPIHPSFSIERHHSGSGSGSAAAGIMTAAYD
ncbi:amphiphysin-like-1 [Diaporthe helianthi]|uniref:Amphiphysin-like-1 n=1 Tax=Diaporthe helianthi TaxID=158607 RepID=A0A2P5HQY1_DIAHE|nr:amphiphysin-like-1 [Diaporthe helianthi]